MGERTWLLCGTTVGDNRDYGFCGQFVEAVAPAGFKQQRGRWFFAMRGKEKGDRKTLARNHGSKRWKRMCAFKGVGLQRQRRRRPESIDGGGGRNRSAAQPDLGIPRGKG
jgi:hypothetical protein